MTRAPVRAVLVVAVLAAMLPACIGLFGGCSSATPPPAPVVVGDPCEAAGARLAELGCPEAKTPAGLPFGDACKVARADGRDWRPDCIALVDSCDEVASAYRTRAGAPCR